MDTKEAEVSWAPSVMDTKESISMEAALLDHPMVGLLDIMNKDTESVLEVILLGMEAVFHPMSKRVVTVTDSTQAKDTTLGATKHMDIDNQKYI